MTSNELEGIVDTATKSFKLAAKAAAEGSFITYFKHMEDAENALLYCQVKAADASVYHAISRLRWEIDKHRALVCTEMAARPKGEA